MSEKIYALLLRLYPAYFRASYGDQALQLFRDRVRDEKGFFPGLRLWLDLLVDLAISVPRQYRHVQPALFGLRSQQRLDGIPSFYVLGSDAPPTGAVLSGFVVSLLLLATTAVLMGRSQDSQWTGAATDQTQRPVHDRSSAARNAAAQADAEAKAGASPLLQPVVTATRFRPSDVQPDNLQSKALLPRFRPSQQQFSQPRPATATLAAIDDVKVDAAERHRVIASAIANLKKFYIYPDVAQKMADALLQHEKRGDYDAVTDGAAFADLLTTQLRDLGHDRHLIVIYSQAPLPEHPTEPTPEDIARRREALERENCMFEKVKILPHNIGYLKLNFFPETSICRSAATAAMASVNHADAIIFDLRDNRGGFPDMVALLAAYLFDHPEYWYNPRENTSEQSWTHSPVPGNRLADKPVYVLTSARTASGAEQFSYDLKMLKRATLVGETTVGAAHAGTFHRLDDHFGIGITETKPINPFSKNDWDGTGVEPDIKVKAEEALERTQKLAQSQLACK